MDHSLSNLSTQEIRNKRLYKGGNSSQASLDNDNEKPLNNIDGVMKGHSKVLIEAAKIKTLLNKQKMKYKRASVAFDRYGDQLKNDF